MSCLTTSATRRSRSVPAAVLIASAAASSHEVLLVPMISVTLYTLMTLSFEHVRPAPGLQSHPALSSGLPQAWKFGLADLTGAWGPETFADHTTTTRAEPADLRVTFQPD